MQSIDWVVEVATRRIAANYEGGIMNRKLFPNATAFVLLILGAAGSGYALSDT